MSTDEHASVLVLGGNFNIDRGTASTNLATEIAKGFESNGFSCHLVPLNQQRSKQAKSKYCGVSVLYHRLPFLDSLPTPVANLRAFFALILISIRCANKKKRPKLLFCMTMWFWASFWIRQLGRWFGIKTVYFLVEEPFALAQMKRDNGDQNWLQFRLHTLQTTFIYASIRSFDWLCCITDNLLQYARDRGADTSNSSMFPNVRFHDASQENADSPTKQEDYANETLTFVYSGRINYTRDEFETLFAAIKRLVDGREASDETEQIEFHIYGSGPDKDIQKIERQIEQLNLFHAVHFHGFVDRNELAKAQQRAFAFLLLKADIPQNRFNFPTKLMDYLKHEKPIVMTKISTHQQYFKDQEDCLFVAPGDVDELFNAFVFLISNRESVRKLGIRAGMKLLDDFSSNLNTAELINKIGLKPS